MLATVLNFILVSLNERMDAGSESSILEVESGGNGDAAGEKKGNPLLLRVAHGWPYYIYLALSFTLVFMQVQCGGDIQGHLKPPEANSGGRELHAVSGLLFQPIQHTKGASKVGDRRSLLESNRLVSSTMSHKVFLPRKQRRKYLLTSQGRPGWIIDLMKHSGYTAKVRLYICHH